MPHLTRIFVLLVSITLLGVAAQAQVSVYRTGFGPVPMPQRVGQQVILALKPLGNSYPDGIGSFDFQAIRTFHGNWDFSAGVDLQESFDLYLCDNAVCTGQLKAQVARVILAPYGITMPTCLDGIVTLRGTFGKASGDRQHEIFAGMLEGLWTGKLNGGSVAPCNGQSSGWADGMIDRPGQIATGPSAALPSLSTGPVDTTNQNLDLVLMTTLVRDAQRQFPYATGQITLMVAVFYP